ncbi:cAMP and cAMP-inhibited cGMP 3',5'-cyclic phosphodiesterase 10A [Lamellibrachia satsuma]|nr:cAMP and cAMP-inhibited cGMP 3',5'-cyclic phosphodiesterase 10A [Lamellibrachia satsuma]
MCDPYKQVSHRRLPPYPGNTIKYRITVNEKEFPVTGTDFQSVAGRGGGMSDDYMRCYLTTHRDVLEEYVMTFIDVDTLKYWLQKKQKLSIDIKNSGFLLSKPCQVQHRYQDPSLKKVVDKLVLKMSGTSDLLPLMNEVLTVVAEATQADGMAMYAVVGGTMLHIYSAAVTTPENNRKYTLKAFGPIMLHTTVAAHVTKTQKSVLVRSLEQDERFPDGIGVEGSMASSVICLPVVQTSGDLICVMEFTRGLQQNPFSEMEFQMATCILSWVSIATSEVKASRMLKKQNDLNDFLLEVSKAFFDESSMMHSLLEKIMTGFHTHRIQIDTQKLESRRRAYCLTYRQAEGNTGEGMARSRFSNIALGNGGLTSLPLGTSGLGVAPPAQLAEMIEATGVIGTLAPVVRLTDAGSSVANTPVKKAKEDPPCQYPDDSLRALAQEPRESSPGEHRRQNEYRPAHSSRAQAPEQLVDKRQQLAGQPDDSTRPQVLQKMMSPPDDQQKLTQQHPDHS